MRTAAAAAVSLELFSEPLPFARPHIGGWAHGDIVAFTRPGNPFVACQGRLLNSFPRTNTLLLRIDNPAGLVEIDVARCRKLVGAEHVLRSPKGAAE